ncbi:WXG100 family type VII secretion target [Kineococcus rubinsiae]|uniref:WXG100 family type VII secretion target n=1 Tax=Kineococcus rubinsiae TaxID=2609562 RepID=UPI00142F61CD|nr:WXG100 family type VII secretion target [Kineococcus rubinsiae]NIZ91143.1 WXG100 family type VII secretion target [Kineococcus rubinsiae]
MSTFQVDSAQVASASAAVQASSAAIAAETEGMLRNLQALEASWKGQAATGFQAVTAQWRATQERVRLSLEEIQRALATAGQQYADVEAANTRMFTA